MWRSPLAVVSLAAVVAGCAAPASTEIEAASSSALGRGDGPGRGVVELTPESLMAKLRNCVKASSSPYAKDVGGQNELDVCKLKNAVFFKADMDIDCDGKRSDACNPSTDHSYQSETAASDSAGNPLDAAKLPYIVVPGVSNRWSYLSAGITMGSVGAVIYDGKIEYGVVGDVGPKTILGEASYAMAQTLGINPNPATGGTDSGVTYIIFTGPSGVLTANEDHDEAVALGQRRAQQLLTEN